MKKDINARFGGLVATIILAVGTASILAIMIALTIFIVRFLIF